MWKQKHSCCQNNGTILTIQIDLKENSKWSFGRKKEKKARFTLKFMMIFSSWLTNKQTKVWTKVDNIFKQSVKSWYVNKPVKWKKKIYYHYRIYLLIDKNCIFNRTRYSRIPRTLISLNSSLRRAWEMSWVTVALSTNENDAVLHCVISGLYSGLLVYDLDYALDLIVYQCWAEGPRSVSW